MSEQVGPKVLSAVRLDPSIYALREDESAFFKLMTGIHDDEQLKQHIIAVQKEAFEIHPYPCIQGFRFLTLKISRMPVYKDVLALGTNRVGAILLDIGCCFGNDVRKAAADGFPASQIVASDIHPEFWELGYKLFKDDPSTNQMAFIPGDIHDDSFVTANPDGFHFPTLQPGESVVYPSLSSLGLKDSLNPLRGKISVIHASSFFHLFTEEQQLSVAKKLATLLSPEPGSIIFGAHAGALEKGFQKATIPGTGVEVLTFSHSPETWKIVWEEEVFGKGMVICDAMNWSKPGNDAQFLVWSVRRL